MTLVRLQDVPIAYRRLGTLRRLIRNNLGDRYQPPGFGRRGFLKSATAVGTAIGFGALGVFPRVREALADHDTWGAYQGCGAFEYPDNCQEPCTGAGSTENRGPEFCTQCAETSQPHGVWGWHYSGFRPYNDPIWELRDLQVNVCSGPNGPLDAWNWNVGPCDVVDPQTEQTITCNPMRIRCHDGRKRTLPDGGWQTKICEGFRECRNANGGQDIDGKDIMCS